MLDLVGSGYLFPGGEEDSLVQLSVFSEEYVNGNETREVEYVHVVLYRHLLVSCVGLVKGYFEVFN